MARYLGPSCKLSRREGTDLFLKSGIKPLEAKCKLETPPGAAQGARKARLSDYGLQLREKQKLRRMYGILERQFRTYYKKAAQMKGSTGENLLKILEGRLDNTVYRMGFAVDARRSPSAGEPSLRDGEQQDREHSLLPGLGRRYRRDPREGEEADPHPERPGDCRPGRLPGLGQVDDKKMVGILKQVPAREDILPDINENLVVELYSK